MSKCRRPVLLFLGAPVIVLQGIIGLAAQDLTAVVRITADRPSTAFVEGQFSNGKGSGSLYFLDRFGSVTGLDKRISNVRLAESNGEFQPARPINGRYVAENIAKWAYDIEIAPSNDRFSAAHISRADARGALLVLDDILPQVPAGSRSARIIFDLPAGWTAAGSERPVEPNTYVIDDIEKAVFIAGPALREKTVRRGRSELDLVISGDWLFTDDEAVKMAGSIFAEHERTFGGPAAERMLIAIMPFPHNTPTGQWEAGSRGSSVTIVSSDMPFKNQSVQRLHEQLRHEIFHLWIPNGVNLTGNYDWFYEGFALYASLKIGVAANRIGFGDMLDTLGRAYDIGGRRTDDSLIGLSKSRWSGSNSILYARGLLIGFLCDIAILERSKGKRSIDNVLRTVFERHRSTPPRDANEAVLAILRSHDEVRELVERYIVAGEAVAWQPYLRAAGLESAADRGPTRLKAVADPSRRQKQMLDDLGYNNWRKLADGIR